MAGIRTLEEFLARTRLADEPHPVLGTKCRLWMGTREHGYGKLEIRGKQKRAHRVAWEFRHGEIPPEVCILHKCDVRACVEDDHLFPGSNRDNAMDKVAKGRGWWTTGTRKTSCAKYRKMRYGTDRNCHSSPITQIEKREFLRFSGVMELAPGLQ